MKNLKKLEQKYQELGKEIEALKKQNSEKEEFEYPIYCKLKNSSLVVKFTDLTTGELVIDNGFYEVNETSVYWKAHTDTNYWQQLEACPETGFFDGQLVWCWDNEHTHYRILRFYDAKNKCTYNYLGGRGGSSYNNYSPFEGNYLDWALKAFKTVKMKTENTLENKAKFFAQYWGQHVLYFSSDFLRKIDNLTLDSVENDDFLELKPISKISDEEAINLGYGNVSHLKSNLDRNIDQLRNLGFAVPWMDLEVEDLIDYGWIKLKED